TPASFMAAIVAPEAKPTSTATLSITEMAKVYATDRPSRSSRRDQPLRPASTRLDLAILAVTDIRFGSVRRQAGQGNLDDIPRLDRRGLVGGDFAGLAAGGAHDRVGERHLAVLRGSR